MVDDRLYQILDYIINQYNKDFHKAFKINEFNDQEALQEVINELQEEKDLIKLKECVI